MKLSRIQPLIMDTHAWLWHSGGNQKLGLRAKFMIDASALFSEAFISVASCWEVGQLAARKRIVLDRPVRSWMYRSIRQTGIKVIALKRRQVMGAIDMINVIQTKDPFDAFIVAAAIHCGAVLVTADTKIMAYAKSTGKVQTMDARK